MKRIDWVYEVLSNYEKGFPKERCKELIEKGVIQASCDNQYFIIDEIGRLLHYVSGDVVKYIAYVGVSTFFDNQTPNKYVEVVGNVYENLDLLQ